MALWVILALLILCYWIYQRRHVYILAAKLPGHKYSLPLIGHTYLFFGYSQDRLFARIREALKVEAEQLPYAKLWLGTQLTILVTDADCIQKIINSRSLLDKGDLLHAADPIVGNGMLFGSGDEVKKHRKGFLPSMNAKLLEEYLQVFHRNSTILVENILSRYHDGSEVHIEHHLHHCTFDAVNETTLDVLTDCQGGKTTDLCRRLVAVYGIVYQDIAKPWLYLGKELLRAVGFKTELHLLCEVFDDHLYNALYKKRQEIHLETSTNDIDGLKTGEDPRRYKITSTLEYILKSDFSISDEDLVMELKNIFMASSDTVAQTTAFLLKMLAVHPDIQEMAYQECRRILGSNTSVPSSSQLTRLQYLDMCIKETLRLFPIAPFLPRTCTEYWQLDDKLTVPPGNTFLMGVFWLHRSPQHWSRPNRFRPEHFSTEEVKARHPAAYLPFSAGPHTCIGQQYAMLFLKQLASTILLKYKIEPAASDYVVRKVHQNGTNANTPRKDGNLKNGNTDPQMNGRHFVSGRDSHAASDSSLKYIPDDYVENLPLGTDISVRLVGGVDIKISLRK